uniref:E3 ubiquitin-protein ligase CHFR n=1 Tax=Callorhinchus milii TaxID=7868 RepID=A0A4W3GCM5_CALMI
MVTLGRGLNVTYRLFAKTCPLMISRNHCTLRLASNGQWTVTDNKSVNGVRINGVLIEPLVPHVVQEGDRLQLGVPLEGRERAEYEYQLIQDRQAPVESEDSNRSSHCSRTKRKHSREEVPHPKWKVPRVSCEEDWSSDSRNEEQSGCSNSRCKEKSSCSTDSRCEKWDQSSESRCELTQPMAAGEMPGTSVEAALPPTHQRVSSQDSMATEPWGQCYRERKMEHRQRVGGMPIAEQQERGRSSTEQQERGRPIAEQRERESLIAEQRARGRPCPEQRERSRPSTGQQDRERPSNEQQEGEGPSTEQRERERPCPEQRESGRPSAEQRERERPCLEQHKRERTCLEQHKRERPCLEQRERGRPSAEQRERERPSAEQQEGERPSMEQREREKPNLEQRQRRRHRLEQRERSGSEKRELEELEAALQQQRRELEEIIKSKDRELEESKSEKEQAQRREAIAEITDVLENELQCIICSEHFIQAVTLNCSHSFCSHCIEEWRKRKQECPMCRQPICSQTRSVVLDSCIDRMVETLSEEVRARRAALIKQRRALQVLDVE